MEVKWAYDTKKEYKSDLGSRVEGIRLKYKDSAFGSNMINNIMHNLRFSAIHYESNLCNEQFKDLYSLFNYYGYIVKPFYHNNDKYALEIRLPEYDGK